MSKIFFQGGRKILWGAPATSGYALRLISSKLCIWCFRPYPGARNGLLKGCTQKSSQWTFLCREPSIKERIWKI